MNKNDMKAIMCIQIVAKNNNMKYNIFRPSYIVIDRLIVAKQPKNS